MSITYERQEIISTTEASRKLGEVLRHAKQKGRMILSKNNHLEAVILPLDNYEEMIKDLEHLLMALEIQERKTRAGGKRVSWESLKAKHGL